MANIPDLGQVITNEFRSLVSDAETWRQTDSVLKRWAGLHGIAYGETGFGRQYVIRLKDNSEIYVDSAPELLKTLIGQILPEDVEGLNGR